MQPQWLDWAQRLQAIAQIGLTFAENPYDEERYEQIRDLAVEISAAHTDTSAERIHDLFAHEKGYLTPKVDVRGVVFRDDAILLVQEIIDDNRWTLPGGWADVGDSPAEAAVREIREESGYETRAIKLLAAYDRSKHHPPFPYYTYKLFFLCELTGGAPTTSHETNGVGFFREDEIPDNLSIGRVTLKQIKRFFEFQRNPNLPTDFD
jgi:ADP-ribose pyrophosphatase YjhB (NUDIX family)